MKKENYGWAICFACALLLFCTSGLATTGFSAYQPYLISVGGMTNTQASSVILFRNLFGMLSMLTTAPLIKKFEVRRVVTVGMLICALSFAVYGFAQNYYWYCVAASLAGCGLGIGGMIPVSVVISRWFEEHRGLALGICMAATGLSVIVASPFITIMVRDVSLQFSFLAEGAFVLAATAVVYLIMRSRPGCLDTLPIGAQHQAGHAQNFAPRMAPPLLYWLMIAGIFVFGMPGNSLYSHISVLYRTEGLADMQVSTLLSVFGFALAFGKCVYGQISDKIGIFRSSWILYFFTAAGTGLCCLAGNGSYAVALCGAALMGFGLAVTTVSISMYASSVSTEQAYSNSVTRFQIASTLGALSFGTVPGILADKTGSYVPAFVIMLILAVVSACVLQFTYRAVARRNAQS